MEQLARGSNLSTAMISKVESGSGNPSISSLRRIAQALEVPLTALLAQEDAEAAAESVLVNHKRIYSYGGATYTVLSSPPNAEATVLLLEAEPGARMGLDGSPHLPHNAYEQAIILDGYLTCTIGTQVFELGPGDSISYPSTLHHFWENLGDRNVTAVWVVSASKD